MTPHRTCLACRRTASADGLLRLVIGRSGDLELELRSRSPGRGAWVCPAPACLQRVARRPERLARALGSRPASAVDLVPIARALCEDALVAALPGAQRAGLLVGGHVAVQRALAADALGGLLVARAASIRRLGGLPESARELPVAALGLDSRALGRAVGKGPRAVLGVRSGRPSRALLRVLRLCASLGYHRASIGRAPCPRRRDATERPGREGKGPAVPNATEVGPEGVPVPGAERPHREGTECPRKRS